MKRKNLKRKNILKYNPTRVEEEIRSILAKVARVKKSEIKKDVNIRDRLGIDSLSAMEVLAAVETKFGITIDEAKAFNVVTVKDLYKLIEKYATKWKRISL